VPLAGDFKEILFADLLQFYCLSGQTAAVSVRAPDDRGLETTGTFFIDGGVLVDAVFDGREGSDAVRRAVRRLNRGAFQVELGARSQRRTIHEPWSALVLEELRQLGGDMPSGLKSAAPALAAAFARGAPRTPTPASGTTGISSTPKGRLQTPPAGIRVTGTQTLGSVPPARGSPAPRSTPAAGTPSVQRTPARGTPALPLSEKANGSEHAMPLDTGGPVAPAVPKAPGSGPHPQASGSGPRRTPPPMAVGLEARQPSPKLPGSGPHPQASASGPRRTPTPAATAVEARHFAVEGSGPRVPPTAPFSRIRRESRSGRFLLWALVVAGAVAAGGLLAVVAARLLAQGAESAANQRVPVAAATPQVVAAPPVTPPTAGVTDAEVVFGMAAPFTGTSKELGRQMKVGLEVAFASANADGGVQGRQLRLVALDDGYEPSRTADVMRELAERRGVFGFVGNVGTPTAAVALPYALGKQMLFFAPFTGAPLLRRDPPDRIVFNYRASYLEETAAIVRYLVEVRRIKPDQIAVFAQNDGYGDAGYQGVVRAMRQFRRDGVTLKVTYERNTTDVANAVARVLEKKDRIKAVVMVATYRAAARFIEQVRTQRPQMLFTNVSFVGSQALAEELVQLGPKFAEGIIVTQVVPLPTSRSTAVMRYQDALARFAPGEKPDFVSLEGYVDGTLLVEALRRTGRTLTTEKLVKALEEIRGLDLGLATPLSFGPTEHQGSHKVWGSVLDRNGNYQPLDLE
jgi:branched-chain amino acid transport system substrate-binding protein